MTTNKNYSSVVQFPYSTLNYPSLLSFLSSFIFISIICQVKQLYKRNYLHKKKRSREKLDKFAPISSVCLLLQLDTCRYCFPSSFTDHNANADFISFALFASPFLPLFAFLVGFEWMWMWMLMMMLLTVPERPY